MTRYFNLNQLKGNAQKEYMDIYPNADVRLQDGIPNWVRQRIPEFESRYKLWMSMSTVAVALDEIEGFSSKTLVNALVPGVYTNGEIFDPFCCDATKITPKQPAKNTGRGRKPIQNKVPTRRNYGTVPSFGTCLQCSCRVNVPFKNEPTRVYNIKVFGNNIQCPGCITEDFSDVKKVLELIKEVLGITLKKIPSPPPLFYEVCDLLEERGYGYLTHLQPTEISIKTSEIQVYSRNYNLHYLPLTRTETSANPLLLNPQEIFTFLRGNQTLVDEWLEIAGLHKVIFEYESSSENTNRRIQAIFSTPKTIEDPKNQHITKCFIECSGKIAINLANNYYWKDLLWRLVVFLDCIFSSSVLYNKKKVSTLDVTEEQIDTFLDRIDTFMMTWSMHGS